ncbi:MAG: hypothetical protein N4A44_03370 [Alphaproteobacteria bacterium]|jgi:hypothetical protein|nr:hypothetical protein [Alphaproteobacteria bacterium]
MSKTLQLRRGTTTEHLTFTGSEGEVTIDTTKQTAIVHNGTNAGGKALAREDLSNVSQETISNKGIAKSDLSNLDMDNLENIAKVDLSNVEPGAFIQFELAKNDLISAQSATEEKQGAISLASKEETIKGQDINKAITPKTLKEYINSFFSINSEFKPSLPPKYIEGFIASNFNEDTGHDITISVGSCRDANNSIDILLTTPITKKLDTSWNEGSEVGGLASALSISSETTYHLFIISKESGEVDAGFDTSLTAENLLSDAEGYTYYRRVYSIITDSNANIIPFNAYEICGGGVKTEYMSKVMDISSAAFNYSLARFLSKVSIPEGANMLSDFRSRVMDGSGDAILFTSSSQPDFSVDKISGDNNEFIGQIYSTNNSDFITDFSLKISDSKIGIRNSENNNIGSLYVQTLGYTDIRR